MLHRFSLFLAALLLTASGLLAQLQSPEQFLGYPIGTRYTPHWRIVAYYQHVAAALPSMVKLQPYGHTYEGRPLMLAFVSSPANMQNLETIRAQNVAMTGLEGQRTAAPAPGLTGTPALVWLSYNVHGNETSSSEAAMMTLYALVDPANTQARQWLQNTVVIMDPCINPDGRDRYVNWFNSVVGRQYNPTLNAREHREPWPGGRSNHYNFDLNRDWAWQTQIETQQRMKVYHQWMPHVHVDFHEQSVNSPYYFAPAAQPYHEVITKWQRDFQTTIGRNHARYFDERGWLYFTKEVFDLLYPSYGDTYPTFNGAIGMTYEQAGGPAGGAAVLTEEGDTLTLYDRALHHHTTGMSTIEVASRNASQLVREFQKFYQDAGAGIGEYKSYVIKHSPQQAARIDALLELLRRNHIRFGTARGGNARGFNYDTGKEENFSLSGNDIVIPAAQPKGTLVKVLFEPNPVLVDSNTYDITAWSMPYVYGLKAYATAQRLEPGGEPAATQVNNPAADPYGYVIRWNGMPAVKLAGQLLQRGIKLRVNEAPFEAGGQQFERGALIVLKTSNQYVPGLWQLVRSMADSAGVQLTPVASGFVDKGYDFGSSKVRPLKARRVALVTGEGVSSLGAGEVWHFFDQQLEYPITLVNNNDLSRLNWSQYDVVILPDGAYRFLSDKTATDAFRSWISSGGDVIALEGAVSALARHDWALQQKKSEDTPSEDPYEALRRYEDRERENLHSVTPGSIFRVELDNTHPLAFGFPSHYYTLKQDPNIYEFLGEDGWNVGVLKRDRQVAGYVGSTLQKQLQDGLLFGVQEIGNGTITYLADDVLFRSFWENGKLLFSNAVFLVGQ